MKRLMIAAALALTFVQDIPSAIRKMQEAIALLQAPSTITVTVEGAQQTIDAAPVGATLTLQAGALYPPLVVRDGKTLTTAGVTLPAGQLDPTTIALAKTPHVRIEGAGTIRGIEVFSPNTMYGVESVWVDQTASNVVLDRVYVHSTLGSTVRTGIVLNGGATSVTDSVVSGYGTRLIETHAIGGWDGPGPYTITNNYLEAAGVNVIFGGGDPSVAGLIPSDIYIARNTLNKPETWRTQDLDVKNLLELKNAQRVTIEDNTGSGSWNNGQTGFGLVLTVRNQSGGCPWCTVAHVLYRRNTMDRIGAGVQILGLDTNPSVRMDDIQILDSTFALDPHDGDSRIGYQIMNGPSRLVIDHNVLTSTGWLKSFMDFSSQPLTGFAFTRNHVPQGDYGVHSSEYVVGLATVNGYNPQGYTWSGDTVHTGGVYNDGPRTITYPAGTVVVQ